MTTEIEKLELACSALEAQRAVLSDAVVDAALTPLYERLRILRQAASALSGETQQRKIVTVLFADIPGFSKISEQLDTEDLRDTSNALWKQLDAIILKHGGRIDKHTGAGLMALWGAEMVREDDAGQAIRAGLQMREALQTFRQASASLHALSESDISLRIGINTGRVIVGLVGTTGEFTALGDTVNLAARLNASAKPGEVLISHDTYRLVRGMFDVAIQPPLLVKGKTETVQTYLVEAFRPRSLIEIRSVEGLEIPLIGRQLELDTLKDAFRRSFGRHPLRLITLVGEMGLGKSRILQEFLAWSDPLPADFYLFQGHSYPSETTTPYALWRYIFSFRFQIQDSDPLPSIHEKLERGFAELLPRDRYTREKAHIIGQLIGFDFSDSPYLRGIAQDPKQMRKLGFATLTRFFTALAENYPVILTADDIHWADRGSLDALTHLCEHIPAATPCLILCTARPALFERAPRWGANLPAAIKLEIGPQPPAESRFLVEQMLQKVPFPSPTLRDLIVDSAEGNPYYIEELVRMFIDEQVIHPGDEIWEIDLDRLDANIIPHTLTGLLQARLDRLGVFERALLQRASVIGRVFWDSALKALTPETQAEQAQLEETLTALRSKELISLSPVSTFAGTQEYAFRHALLRDVAYETVLNRHRQQYHGLIAEWLITVSGEQHGEYLSTIAEHYEKAGNNERAAATLLEAGDRALHLSAFEEAFHFFQRALPLIHPRQTRILTHIHLRTGEAFYRSGELSDAVKSTAKALELARELSSNTLFASCLCQLGQIYVDMGRYNEAENTLRQALPMARLAGSPAQPTLARILYGLGSVYWRLGDFEKARACCEESRDLARKIGETHTLLLALNRLGAVMGSLGNATAEENNYMQALSLAVSVDNHERAAMALNNLGALADEKGDLAEAQGFYLQAISLVRKINAQQSLPLYLINLGNNQILQGQLDGALPPLREGLALSDHLGTAPWTMTAMLTYARLLHARGETERAYGLLRLARLQPAFSSDHLRLVQQIFTHWQVTPENAEARMAAAPTLNWKTTMAELLIS